MVEATRKKLLEHIRDDDVVLDIGGWADPFERADWIMDVGAYESRGLYQRAGWTDAVERPAERFSESTWIQRNASDKEPFPFADDEIDFVICSQTLEDLRDPVWVCSEISRVGKAGWIEVPSRLLELSWGVDGEFAGYNHHHWLVEVTDSGIEFVFKQHDIHGRREFHFPRGFLDSLPDEERVQQFWWQGSFTCRERILFFEGGADDYLGGFVSRELARRPGPYGETGLARLRRALR